jgi:hypothetical protein
MDSSAETVADAVVPHKVIAHSKVHPTALRSQVKRLRWTPEEDATVRDMKNHGRRWEDIHTCHMDGQHYYHMNHFSVGITAT